MSNPRFPSVDGHGKLREEHLPDRLAPDRLKASFVPLPLESGSAGQVLVTDPLSENGLGWSTPGGGTVWRHPDGAVEEAGNRTYTASTAMYGLGIQTLVDQSVDFNQVVVRFASKSATLDVNVRVYECLTANGLDWDTSDDTTLLSEVTLPASVVPRGTAPGEVVVNLPATVRITEGRYLVVLLSTDETNQITIPLWRPADETKSRPRIYLQNGPESVTVASADFTSVPPRLASGDPSFVALSEQVRLATSAAVAAQAAAEAASGETGQGAVPPRVVLGPVLHAVAGDTLQVFTHSVVESTAPYALPTTFVADKGATFPRFFEWTPTSGGPDMTLTAHVYDHDGTVAASDTTTVKVKDPTSPSTTKRVMLIGDSTMTRPRVDELRRRLVGAGGSPAGAGLSNIEFLGNRPLTDVPAPQGYFGYGGWTLANWIGTQHRIAFWITVASHDKDSADQKATYADTNGRRWYIETIEPGRLKVVADDGATTIPPSGELTWVSGGTHTTAITYSAAEQAPSTPLWNPTTNKFSIKYWCDTYAGGTYPDIIEVVLGLNDLGLSDRTGFAPLHRTFLDTVKSEFPGVKVHLYGMCPPSPDGGLGTNYGASGVRADHYLLRRRITDYNLMLQQVAAESAYATWTTYIDQGAQFDAEYGYPAADAPVNARSVSTERRGTNGIHPNWEGYLQLSDVHYRALVHAL